MRKIAQTGEKRAVPHVKEFPLLGSMLQYATEDRLSFMSRVSKECGEIGLFHIGPIPIYQINSAQLMQEILVEIPDAFEKGQAIRQSMSPILGNGLFVSEGDFHHRQRKMMAPAFQPRHIKSYATSIVNYADQLHINWANDAIIDIDQEMTRLTMSIVGKIFFDADVFSETDEIGGAVTVLLDYVNRRLFEVFPLPLSWPTPRNKRVKNALTTLDNKIQLLITERIKSSHDLNDLLALLVRAQEEDGSRMTDTQIRDEALTLFGAGYETTARSLSWTWYLLSQHPSVYQKMLEEIDTVLQGRRPTYEDLPSLPYTLQVYKETLRLYPQAYLMMRGTLKDVTLNGYLIPKGSTVLLVPYVLHRNEKDFPDSDQFLPERFHPDREKLIPRYAYLPFGAGPRVCIGNHFALMESHLVLATMAQRVAFELLPGQDVKPETLVSLRPKNGIKVRVHRRD